MNDTFIDVVGKLQAISQERVIALSEELSTDQKQSLMTQIQQLNFAKIPSRRKAISPLELGYLTDGPNLVMRKTERSTCNHSENPNEKKNDSDLCYSRQAN